MYIERLVFVMVVHTLAVATAAASVPVTTPDQLM